MIKQKDIKEFEDITLGFDNKHTTKYVELSKLEELKKELKRFSFCLERGTNCKGCRGGCCMVILLDRVNDVFGVEGEK